MEENNQASNPLPAPSTGTIIDVQVSPAQPSEQTDSSVPFIPSVEADDSPMQSAPEDAAPAPEAPADNAKPQENQNQPPAMPPEHKGSTPVAVIVAAVVVALGLIGITV